MKQYFRLLAAVVAVAALFAPAAIFAQQTESRITGRVLDESKGAMPGVTVTVTSKQTGALRTTVSGGDGEYAVTNLGPGTYTVVFELSGFANQTREVLLGVGQFENVDVVMGIATVTESVEVTNPARSPSCSARRHPQVPGGTGADTRPTRCSAPGTGVRARKTRVVSSRATTPSGPEATNRSRIG